MAKQRLPPGASTVASGGSKDGNKGVVDAEFEESHPPHGAIVGTNDGRAGGLVWLQLSSNALIALAYLTISLTLVALVRRIRDVPFSWMYAAFGVFILACGLDRGRPRALEGAGGRHRLGDRRADERAGRGGAEAPRGTRRARGGPTVGGRSAGGPLGPGWSRSPRGGLPVSDSSRSRLPRRPPRAAPRPFTPPRPASSPSPATGSPTRPRSRTPGRPSRTASSRR